MDVIWLSSVGGIWGEKTNDALWESLHGIHSFAVIFSVVNIFTKVKTFNNFKFQLIKTFFFLIF